MFDDYYKIYEKIEKEKKIDYDFMLKIKSDFDKLTKKFMNKDELITSILNVFTLLDDINHETAKGYFSDFTSSLEYYSDRMNLNRWIRLQLLLSNAINKAYSEENIYERNYKNEEK